MRRFLPALAVLLLLVTPAAGQFHAESQLATVKEVLVTVEDNVRDGCLPQPNVLKIEAELILRRSGIKVVEKDTPYHTHFLEITPNGGVVSQSLCIASLSVDLWRIQEQRDGLNGLVLASQHGGIQSGPKDSFQQYLREFVNAKVSALANEILKARGQ